MLRPNVDRFAHRAGTAQMRQRLELHAEPVQGNADFTLLRRRAPVRGRRALLSLTVEQADVFQVRRALGQGGVEFEFLKVTRIPRDHRVQLQIGLDATSAGKAMSQIIGCMDAAEFGRITLA
jgi:hypothetical protein